MLNVIFAEFLKLKRSRLLLFVVAAGVIPAFVKLMQSIFEQSPSGQGTPGQGMSGSRDWVWFVSSKREISMLLIFVAVVMSAAFLFSMEYRYGTAATIFTSHTSRIKGYLSKLSVQFAVVVLLLTTAAVSDLLAGLAAFGERMPEGLFGSFVKAYLWQVLLYCLISTIVALFAIWTKKFVLSAVFVFGYLMLAFPWHLKGNVFILPFMTPTVMAARIFNSGNYIYSDYFAGGSVDLAAAVILLAAIAAVSAILGIVCYRRQQLTN